jgi:hypothetical protein
LKNFIGSSKNELGGEPNELKKGFMTPQIFLNYWLKT